MNRQRIVSAMKQPLFWWLAGLGILILAGLGAAAVVFTQGLVVTNLSDLVPWGLWISIDLSAIALSGGAFAVSAIAYLLRRKDFRPVAKTAVFVGLIGYSIAMMMLLLDVGRPERFWHGFVFWNIHSPLWEVTMCIGLYFMVLMLEVTPIVGRWDVLQKRVPRVSNTMSSVHRLTPFLALAGLILSTLHQSSLGLTFGKLVARPIWYGPWIISILFLVSAVVGGLALTTLVTLLASKVTPRARVNKQLLAKLSTIVGWAVVGLFVLRWWDLMQLPALYETAETEAMRILTRGRLSFNFWGLEIVLGMIVPAILLLVGRLRRQEHLQIAALAFVVIGVVAYRWDTNLVGQMVVWGQVAQSDTPLFANYVPSLIEVVAAAGVLAYGLLAFTLGVRHLNVIDHGSVAEAPAETTPSAAMVPSSST